MKKSRSHASWRLIITSVCVMAMAAVFIINIFYRLYDVSKQNILSLWNNNTVKISTDVSYYLKMPMDAVAFSTVTVNRMMKKKATHEEVSEYLINQTKIYASVINDNTTGVYAYYKGEYLDGSGWIAPDDYVPTSRPWYTAALHGRGEIVLVKPYMNMQTYEMMMSVSCLLDDNASVVSMDVFLDSIQKTAEDISQNELVEEAMVIDHNGHVIAHSDKSKVGTYLLESEDPEDRKLSVDVNTRKSDIFHTKKGNKGCSVFTQDINDDWKTVLVLNERKMFSSLQSIYLFSATALILVLAVLTVIFLHINRKRKEAAHLLDEVNAVADIYVTVLKINVKKDTMMLLRGDDEIDALLHNNMNYFSKRAPLMAKQMSSKQSRELMLKFMDPDTLEDRLRGVKSISQEFVDNKDRWMRIRFIVVDRDEKGRLNNTLLAFESIDEDRRRQEILRRISETDMMTGIYNRVTGESLIREKILNKQDGMFCMMDADKFKSINDNYGHNVGDKVIIAIADCMKTAFRDVDIVFRLGGDEFAVYAEGVIDAVVGRIVMDRFFNCIDRIEIPELGDRKISMSVGATFFRANKGDTFEVIYQRADEAAYESKKTEGNMMSFKNARFPE